MQYENKSYCTDSTFVFKLDIALQNIQGNSFYFYYFDTPFAKKKIEGDTIHLHISSVPIDYAWYSLGLRKNEPIIIELLGGSISVGFNGRVYEDLQKIEIPPKTEFVIHVEKAISRIKKRNLRFRVEGSYFSAHRQEILDSFKNLRADNIYYSPIREEILYETKINVRKSSFCKGKLP